MTIRTILRHAALPIIAAGIFAAPTASANTPPAVAINGLQSGGLAFNGPFQISGSASDSDGVTEIYGTLQNTTNNLFFTPDGRFVERPTRLAFKFNQSAPQTNWISNAYALPAGRYVYRMRVEDGQKIRSEIIEVPVVIGAVPTANTTRAPAVVKPAPAVQPVAQPNKAPAAVVAGAKSANGMNYCASNGTDADGDGYGWENNSSCVVAGSKADKNPNCASAGSDPDGDGWGWENERSCIVVSRCQSDASDPDGDGWGWENERSCKIVKTSGKYAACANPASDPDGDGYGWENNKTCLVAK